MKAVPPGVELDHDQKAFRAQWKITNKILYLKEMKYRDELSEAQSKLDYVEHEMDYNALKAKAAKKQEKNSAPQEGTRPIST